MSQDTRSEQGKKVVPPYLPYKTFKNFIDGLRVTMPGRIDRSLMPTLSGTVQANLMKTLEFFHLASHNGVPTARLEKLVQSEGAEWEALLREMLAEHYPFLFDDGINLENATMPQFSEHFQKSGASGDTVRKGISFFVSAAKDAGIPLSKFITEQAKRGPKGSGKGRTAKKSNKKNGASGGGSQDTPSQDYPPQTVDLRKEILDKLPRFDPAWSAEERQSYFDAIREITQITRDLQGE